MRFSIDRGALASQLTGPAHGRRGFFHDVANRSHHQARIALGGLRGLVVQHRPDDRQAVAAAGQPNAQCAAQVVDVQSRISYCFRWSPCFSASGV